MKNDDSQSQPSESSVLHGNDAFVNKLLSRNSTSERDIYSCKQPGVVPFIWEVQPGIPKDPPNDAFVPLPKQKPSSTPLESSLELKDSSLNPNKNQFNQTRPSLTKPTSAFLNRSKKTRNEFPKFSHSDSSNSDDHDFFSSPCASKSPSSTTARASPSSKALATSLPMSSKLRSLAKKLLRRLF